MTEEERSLLDGFRCVDMGDARDPDAYLAGEFARRLIQAGGRAHRGLTFVEMEAVVRKAAVSPLALNAALREFAGLTYRPRRVFGGPKEKS